MDIRHLRFFVVLAEELHFTRAAERLHVAQPHLSQEIRRLERELGMLLVERSRRQVALTPAGVTFAAEARDILARLETAVEHTRRTAAGRLGRLVVGFAGSAGYDVFPAAVRRFRERYPDVWLELIEMPTVEQFAALRERRIDVGVGRPVSLEEPQLAFMELSREQFVVALPADAECLDPISLAQLAHVEWITFAPTGGAGLHVQFLRACAEAGFEPRVVQSGGHVPTMLSLVAAGLGWALVPEPIALQTVPGVRYVRLREPVPSTVLCLGWREGDTSTTLANFRSCFRSSPERVPA